MSMVQEAIYRWCIEKKLMTVRTKTIYARKKEKKVSAGSIPEELKFCDSEICEILNKNEKNIVLGVER